MKWAKIYITETTKICIIEAYVLSTQENHFQNCLFLLYIRILITLLLWFSRQRTETRGGNLICFVYKISEGRWVLIGMRFDVNCSHRGTMSCNPQIHCCLGGQGGYPEDFSSPDPRHGFLAGWTTWEPWLEPEQGLWTLLVGAGHRTCQRWEETAPLFSQ